MCARCAILVSLLFGLCADSVKASFDVMLSVIKWSLTLAGTDDCHHCAPELGLQAEVCRVLAHLRQSEEIGALWRLQHKSLFTFRLHK